MKKSEVQGIAGLIVLGIVIYPFVWIHDNFGWGGIISFAVIVFGGFFYWNYNAVKKDDDAFNELVIYVLNNRLQPSESRKVSGKLMKTNFPRYELLRNVEILRDSVEIALSSKKRDTAESRMSLAIEKYNDIKNQTSLIESATFNIITERVKQTEKQFYTKLFENIAIAHLDKADKLKTIKSKTKYLQLAKDALIEGLNNEKSEKEPLKRLMSKVNNLNDALLNSS